MCLCSHFINQLFAVADRVCVCVCVCAGAPGIISSPYPGAAGFAPAIGFHQAGKLPDTVTLSHHISVMEAASCGSRQSSDWIIKRITCHHLSHLQNTSADWLQQNEQSEEGLTQTEVLTSHLNTVRKLGIRNWLLIGLLSVLIYAINTSNLSVLHCSLITFFIW